MVIAAITGRGNVSIAGAVSGIRIMVCEFVVALDVVDVVVELHDTHDAVIDVDVVARHRERLHVADNLFGALAATRDDMNFRRDGVGPGHHTGGADAWYLPQGLLELRQ